MATAEATNNTGPFWRNPTVRMITAVVVIIAWAAYLRTIQADEPFPTDELAELRFDVYIFGIAVLETLMPVFMVYLLSLTPFFRRIISQTDLTIGDKRHLFFTLTGIYLLFLLYQFGIRTTIVDDTSTNGLLLIFMAGWLGGRSLGFNFGVFIILILGLQEYILEFPHWEEELGSFALFDFIQYVILLNIYSIVIPWQGFMAGLVAEQWPQRRFQTVFALSIGLIIQTIAFILIVFATNDIYIFLEGMLPNWVAFVLAIVAFILMVKRIQDEETRRQAEAAQLELTQANLALTETQLALAQAELRALHAQINPHFFFNSLNTIRYFIRVDPDKARELLIRLSEIFQRTLSAGEFVALQEEISHVEAYLSLEKARLDERLTIIWTNMAPHLLTVPVPTLCIQPIVENAIIHGLAPQAAGGTLHIVINQTGDDLLIQVDDDGVGFDTTRLTSQTETAVSSTSRTSIGLRNVDERLRMLYGPTYKLLVNSQVGQGTRVIIRIPIEEQSDD